MERKLFISQYLEIICVFCIIQVVALLFAYLYFNYAPSTPNYQSPIIFSTPTSAVLYILYIAVTGIVIAIFFKYWDRIAPLIRNMAIYKFIKQHLARIISVVTIIELALIIYLFYIYTTEMLIITFGFVLLSLLWLFVFKKGQNKKLINICVNIFLAVSLGLAFQFNIALLFFGLLALYDFIAVFITKHMLVLAQGLMKIGILSTIAMYTSQRIYATDEKELPDEIRKDYEEHKDNWIASNTALSISGLGMNKINATIESNKMAISNVYSQSKIPIVSTMALGSGDLVFPAIITISALPISLPASLILLAGSILGVAITFCVLHITKRSLPAIPFIGIGIVIALGVVYLLYGVI